MRRWWPVGFIALLVLLLHALPGSELDTAPWWALWRLDALLHSAMFALLATAGLIAVVKGRLLSSQAARFEMFSRAMRWIVLVCVLYGGLLECAQWLVFSGRGADWTDVLADGLGAGLGVAAFWALYLRRVARNI
ncbi:MAG: VanZ family protein [Flavobacteriales bacterium]|jgi:hypothetical protein|nr:VanZ family protein [Flavobacteriales bacterium]